jgi:site-specific recombinase XerD
MNAITPNLPVLYVEPVERVQLPDTLRDALKVAADFAANEKAPATRKAYDSDFRIFEKWCATQGLCALPASPAAVAAFIADQAAVDKKPSTLGRRIAAIKHAHRKANETSPTDDERVKSVLSGARRTLGVAPRRLTPVLTDTLKDMVRMIPGNVKGLRDRALLLICWSGALRRSELVGMNVEHVEFTDQGMRVLIPRSKSDQQGAGQTIAIISARNSVYCPVKALRAWLDVASITQGAIFPAVHRGGHLVNRRLGAEAVRRLVKRYVAKLGFDPKQFGAHSLRSGPLTSGAQRNASIARLQQLSRHKSVDVLLNTYIRPVDLFRDHCLEGLL